MVDRSWVEGNGSDRVEEVHESRAIAQEEQTCKRGEVD